jgi:RNA polymerase sigma factor (sigma-70 family)
VNTSKQIGGLSCTGGSEQRLSLAHRSTLRRVSRRPFRGPALRFQGRPSSSPAKPSSHNQTSLDCFDAFTIRFIGRKVSDLIGQAGLSQADRSDLLQDFAIDLIQRRKKYDPKAGKWEAFVVVVCQNRYASILAHHRAKMRSHTREAGSLSRHMDENGTEVGSTISDSHQARRTGQRARTEAESWDLSHDVAQVLAEMPPLMRKACQLIMRGTKAAAARELGMSQGALYDWLDRIRARFEKADLRAYLE